ncbi:MAG: anti-sigma B factor antagonist [Limisphaerales bacterium]|jgi:anti-sigma B factor antagonist
MKIEERFHNGIHFFQISGDLDASSALELDKVIQSAMSMGHYTMIFDCAELLYIASAGLGVFISHRDEVHSQDGDIVFFGMKERVYNVFKMLGLTELFNIVEKEDEALGALKLKGLPKA